MKRYLDLIPISAKIHRKQNRMTHICIILAVFLITAMFGLADMFLQGQIMQQIQNSGNWHYQFPDIERKQAELISKQPEVKVSGWHSAVDSAAGYLWGGYPVAISGQEKDVFEDIFLGRVAEGRYPAADNEIAVPLEMKESNILCIGDSAALTLPNGHTAEFTITGFLKDTGRLVPEDDFTVVLTDSGLDLLESIQNTGRLERKYVIQLSRLCNMPSAVWDIKKQLDMSEMQETANTLLLSVLGQIKGNDMSQIYSVAFGLSIIVMVACILMISSSLNSNVIQRTEFFGMMRCLGATKRQIMRFVCCEGLFWCISAIPAGIVSGIIVVWIISALMRAVSPVRLSYMPVWGISWISIAVGILLGILTVLLAARSPARKAAQVSPLEAVSGNYYGAAFRKAANSGFLKIETALGIYHAQAGKKRLLLTIAAFAVCIILFLAFTTIIDFMRNAIMPLPWTPELSIVSEDNTCSIKSNLLDVVYKNPKVKRAYSRMFLYDMPAVIADKLQNANLVSYEKHQFFWAADALLEGSVRPAMQEENQVLLIYNEKIPVHAGDSITLLIDNEEINVTVAGILADIPLAREEGTETIICSEQTFNGLTGESGYTIIDVQFKGSATERDVMAVKCLFSEGTVFTDKLSQVREQRNFYYAFSILVYGFLVIIAAITIFHIMNTINMSVSAKSRLYGSMRAIGMSNHQLIKMIIAEAATYAVSGSLVGCILGVPLHMVIYISFITTFWGDAWTIPFAAIGTIVGIVLITTILVIRSPAKRICGMSIVENIGMQ